MRALSNKPQERTGFASRSGPIRYAEVLRWFKLETRSWAGL